MEELITAKEFSDRNSYLSTTETFNTFIKRYSDIKLTPPEWLDLWKSTSEELHNQVVQKFWRDIAHAEDRILENLKRGKVVKTWKNY